ncbi:MAG TPA: membrane protein insertase YidC [Actinocrinis sp.]|nr:membrane protein insertase YidC [Actinocrinis sp.]
MQVYDDILAPIIWVVSWIVVRFHQLFSNVFNPDSGWAWGLSILCLTIVIRAALIPLFVKQIRSTQDMQRVQPELKALQAKYKKELERAKLDPVKKREVQQRQQRDTMALYKEHGTNPFSSCLPVLIQMPFWGSLYRMLYQVANKIPVGVMTTALVTSARNAHVFGVPISAHLTTPAAQLTASGVGLRPADPTTVKIVIIIMIAIYVATQFTTQRQMMLKNAAPDNPMVQQQKMMLYVMPFFMVVFCFIAPMGVLIYLLTTNFWTMGQQFYILRNSPVPGSPAYLAKEQRQAEKQAARESKRAPQAIPGTAALATGVEDTAPPAPLIPPRVQPKRTTKSKRKR